MGKHQSSHVDITTAARLVRQICQIAGEPLLLHQIEHDLRAAGVIAAVRTHNTGTLFNWLTDSLSYQGIADAVARGYILTHGGVTARAVARGLERSGSCDKLAAFDAFIGCGYRKALMTCSRPATFAACPLPRHNLRNGRLNQTAYSLHLFLRDIAHGDLVGWIDQQFERADHGPAHLRGKRLAAAVVEPMRRIHGVSDKVLTMTLSWLLLVADPGRERWRCAGTAMVAVDTLVHNWLWRTGILRGVGCRHSYGPLCYRANGCADIILRLARRVDCSRFNPELPRYFPRYVQHAIWRFCAQSELGVCNGIKIDDRKRCKQRDCDVYASCRRIALHPSD